MFNNFPYSLSPQLTQIIKILLYFKHKIEIITIAIYYIINFELRKSLLIEKEMHNYNADNSYYITEIMLLTNLNNKDQNDLKEYRI